MDTFDVKIEHCLCGISGATIDDIKDVYSHPQAFMQSNKFIEEHGWGKVNLANTAISARYISEQSDKSRGCIASENAAIFMDLIFYIKALILMILIQHSLLLSAVREWQEEMQV